MIAAIKKGNEFAYEQAFLQKRRKVYNYFLNKTQTAEDAKDLLQTTFLKLWQYRHSLSEDYTLDQHLFQISRTVLIDHIRKQNTCKKIKTKLQQKNETEESVSISMVFDVNRQLTGALSGMPEVRREVFRLHRVEGYSYHEISHLLSISVKSVDNHLSKAIRHLKKAFIILPHLIIFFCELACYF